MTSVHRDVLIVGAGIVGAACADALSTEGFAVTVIESQGVSAGTTAAGMGHLVVMDDSEAQFALTQYSAQLWKNLAAEMPRNIELDPCGTLWVAADDEEMTEVHRKHTFYAQRNVITEILDANQLARAEPNLRPGLAGGLRVPGDMVLYPPAAAQWLLNRAIARGAKLIHAHVTELSGHHARLQNGTHLSAAYTINAAGIHSPRLSRNINVRPRKGHLIITDRYPQFLHHQLIELGYLKSAHAVAADSVAFNIQPRKTGQLLIGSSRQYGSEDPAIEQDILQRMIHRATQFMPALASLSVLRAWTGFRPSTPDKLPLIGPAPHDPNLIYATGHEGLGITTALATARLIAHHLLNRTSAIDPAPYLPSRFAKEPLDV
jgi:glycine/D-amino acid oxidase-like deaminating enzyme